VGVFFAFVGVFFALVGVFFAEAFLGVDGGVASVLEVLAFLVAAV
jgi:hypothetical protein